MMEKNPIAFGERKERRRRREGGKAEKKNGGRGSGPKPQRDGGADGINVVILQFGWYTGVTRSITSNMGRSVPSGGRAGTAVTAATGKVGTPESSSVGDAFPRGR